MIKVGISGKIASGKSEVEKIIKSLGYEVFDMDFMVHKLYDKKTISDKILQEFKTTDRKEIGKIIFDNKDKKATLESILFPELKKIIFDLFEKYKNEKILFISGALLFKSGFYKLFDKTIFVDSKEEIRLERLMKRNNLDIKTARLRLNLQDEGNFADFIIENNEDFDKLKEKTKEVIDKLNGC
ncbi:MAG: dephospho-CoA kinase [Candidatus Gastranaerophilales bacterium]|nr:dephospho-CoA kinase [Candidatus Gastranaerophilales bacterium]